jgi:hypothetical protein
MGSWERLAGRDGRLWRWIYWAGWVLWVLLLAGELSASRPDATRALGVLVMGGAALYFFRAAVLAAERARIRRRRQAARRIRGTWGPTPGGKSRADAVAALIGRDAPQLAALSRGDRLRALIDGLLQRIASLQSPQEGCCRAMGRCLCLLEMGRARWGVGRLARQRGGAGPGDGLPDEEFLQILLCVVLLLSALFRLHTARWGMPAGPFARGPVARLRGGWIPFCALKPSQGVFPPPLPPEAERVLASCDPRDRGMLDDAASWVLAGERDALRRLADGFVKERGAS